MREYIMQFDKAIYDEKSGEAVFQPILKEEVIRCKDCKHFHCGTWLFNLEYAECNMMHGWHPTEEDFCSYGVKKEEENGTDR